MIISPLLLKDKESHTNITGIETLITYANWRSIIFVKVFTDEGMVGVGEPSLEWNEWAVEGAIRNLSPLVIGRDPSRIEELWQILYRDPYWRGGPVITTALSGIEQDLWDIAAKRLGVPVYQLLGSKCRERLRAYANAWYREASTPRDFAEGGQDGGEGHYRPQVGSLWIR